MIAASITTSVAASLLSSVRVPSRRSASRPTSRSGCDFFVTCGWLSPSNPRASPTVQLLLGTQREQPETIFIAEQTEQIRAYRLHVLYIFYHSNDGKHCSEPPDISPIYALTSIGSDSTLSIGNAVSADGKPPSPSSPGRPAADTPQRIGVGSDSTGLGDTAVAVDQRNRRRSRRARLTRRNLAQRCRRSSARRYLGATSSPGRSARAAWARSTRRRTR